MTNQHHNTKLSYQGVAIRTLCLFAFFLSLLVVQPSTIKAQSYDEGQTLVFEPYGNSFKSYYKFSEPDVTKYIITNRWTSQTAFTEAEKKMMYQYTYASASPINLALDQVMGDTSQLDAQLQQSVALLDSATHKLTIPWNIIVYRYVYETFLTELGISKEDLARYYYDKTFDPQILSAIKPGTHYTKQGFMSTTAIKNAAMPHRSVELRIRVPQGSQAAFVQPYSFYPYEMELLFPRQCTLEIIGANLSDDHTRLLIETRLLP